ncbi:hypothetical protein ANN_27551 [Periplaneta americana]|uniref:Uncharacterized protein n=1 Tax=Periplaneta americana TaxID=6978 RepID=A0ABQ8RWK0_PERAM|nr:hypothetical protein ANN_27551 [Periplaneta americana]
MAGLREGGNEPADSLKAICDNAGEMSPGSSTESYPAFARIGLRENPGKNLNQVTCPDRDSNPGHLVSQPDALTVTPQLVCVSANSREKAESDALAGLKAIEIGPATSKFEREIFDHSPYSPDLAPSDFYLFRLMKRFLAGKRFHNDAEVQTAADSYDTGIQTVVHRYDKCLNNGGDYVEK